MEKELQEKTSELFSISDIPEKSDSFTVILYNKGISVEHEEKEEISRPRSNRMCFNCGKADHYIRECPRPPNYTRIAKNRMNFINRGFNKLDREFTRYHKEIDDRFSGFRPGVISRKLKDALRLSDDKLPRYIYNMRVLGYPPGWLEEAKISYSGISMLDSNGERVPDADEEEGEIFTNKTKYDPAKIIDYPGFNVWPHPGTINETDFYCSLPMCYDQNKEVFIERLCQASLSPDFPKSSNNSSHLNLENDSNMDIEDLDIDIKYDNDNVNVGFVPPLPEEDVPKPPPPPPPEDLTLSEGEIVSKSEDSDSEQEEGELPCKVRRTKDVTPKGFEEKDKLIPSSTSLSSKEEIETVKLPDDLNNSCSSVTDLNLLESSSMKSEDTFGRVKSVEFGTLVLNHSSYITLPSPEEFRKDISDVVYFENLPNSTGKYERLKNVLKNVRSKLNILKGGGWDSSKK